MILPIGHERSDVHRWPIVSIGLVAVNLMVTLLLNPEVAAHRHQSIEKLESVLDYLVEHPWIEVDDRLPLPPWARTQLDDVRAEIEAAGVTNDVDTMFVQRQFDELVDEWSTLSDRSPLHRWGYVPARPSVLSLFTTQFVHAGWLHLLTNLLILYLAGPPIEDRLGRPVFLLVYLGAGIAATLMHAAFAGDGEVPLVGASGAIAGLMAAFLVYFASTRLRFVWLLPPFFKTFSLPAAIILPLWIANEVKAALDARADPSTAGGVANFAHVGGFAFGLAATGLLSVTGIERRLRVRVDTKTGAEQRADIEEIYSLLERDRPREAWQAAQRIHASEPDDPERGLLLWRTARQTGNTASALGRASRLVRDLIGGERHEEALVVLSEMAEEHPDLPLGGPEKRKLTEALEAVGERSWSEALQEVAAEEPPPTSPRFAPAGSSTRGGEAPAGIEWRCLSGAPSALLEQGLAVTVDGQRRLLAYARVAATALGRIDDSRVLPYYVIDLVLTGANDPAVQTTLRVLAPPWEGGFLESGDLGEQCQTLTERIRGAAGCPSLTATTPPPTFRSLQEYESSLTTAWRAIQGSDPRDASR